MSQVSQATISTRSQLHAHRAVVLAALLALLATTAVVLVLAIDRGSSSTGQQSQAAVRSDGGPNESAVAASIAPRPTGVDESSIAASIGAAEPNWERALRIRGEAMDKQYGLGDFAPSGPDESRIAAAVSGH